jgi:hypothetical protein
MSCRLGVHEQTTLRIDRGMTDNQAATRCEKRFTRTTYLTSERYPNEEAHDEELSEALRQPRDDG